MLPEGSLRDEEGLPAPGGVAAFGDLGQDFGLAVGQPVEDRVLSSANEQVHDIGIDDGVPAGDLLDVGGYLTAYTVVPFDGREADQKVTIAGDLSAPALVREGLGDENPITVTLEVEARGREGSTLASPISLLGSLGAEDFSENQFSADTGTNVSLVFKSEVLALGDVVADQVLKHGEQTQLRRIAKALNLTQDEYNALQTKHRDKLSTLS